MEGTPFLSRLWYWMTRNAAHRKDLGPALDGPADEVGPETYDPPEAYQRDDWPVSEPKQSSPSECYEEDMAPEPPFRRHYPSRFGG